MPNAASLTSIFYHTPIRSVAEFEYQIDVNKLTFAPQNGGCSLIFTEMPIGEKADRSCCLYAIDIIAEILSCHPKINISVLSKFRATVRMLQNCFVSRFGGLNNVLIDTVERVQGMTCDICLYYIPNTMMSMSLEKSLFNVATSRAKQLTIIVSDKSILNTTCDRTVATYLKKVSMGDFTPAPSQNSDYIEKSIEAGEINLKIKGKIDLSQFDTPKQKSVRSDSKKNIYIIDTNVFVNYPDIISKIDSKYSVVLSAKVIDELDKLKITLDSEGKRNVEKALRSINKSLDSSNVTMELSDSSLLPLDFNKKSPDNNILSVALKYKEENPILLTSDNGLQVKAKGLKISTISLKDFLKH